MLYDVTVQFVYSEVEMYYEDSAKISK